MPVVTFRIAEAGVGVVDDPAWLTTIPLRVWNLQSPYADPANPVVLALGAIAAAAANRPAKGGPLVPPPLALERTLEVAAVDEAEVRRWLAASPEVTMVMPPVTVSGAKVKLSTSSCTTASDGYLGEALVGVGALPYWGADAVPAVRLGAGVAVGVVELSFPHLPDVPTMLYLSPFPHDTVRLHGSPTDEPSDWLHGASTLGVLFPKHGGVGGFRGLCPEASPWVLQCPAGGGANEMRDAILQAAARLVTDYDAVLSGGAPAEHVTRSYPSGAILLVEGQADLPNPTNAPANVKEFTLEFEPSIHEAMRYVTWAGIAVIEPAGNRDATMEQTMIDLRNAHPSTSWRDPASTPSGAIIVGAAEACTNVRMKHMRGPRVNLFAWGGAVRSLGYGGTESAEAANYSGTSSAAAIVAGCAALVQAKALAETGSYLPPANLLSELLVDGSPSVPGTNDPLPSSVNGIGLMPNLAHGKPVSPTKSKRLAALTILGGLSLWWLLKQLGLVPGT